MNWEIEISVCTLLYVKEGAKESLLQAQGTLPRALWWPEREGNPEKGDMSICTADLFCCTA